MIKDFFLNIFFPEQIRSYYLFEKRIVGIYITKFNIYATVISLKGYKKTIENFLEENIENGTKIDKALNSIFLNIGKFDELYSAISCSVVIFKELSLPFVSEKKIKLILPYEVENLLPFSLDDAVVDCIITKQEPQENTSDILVSAVKKNYLEEHLKLFETANINIDKITVDILELYGLYLKLHPNKQNTVVLLDIGANNTNIAIIINNQLKYIRSLPKGIFNIIKKLNLTHNIELSESRDYLIRFGIQELDQELDLKDKNKSEFQEKNIEENSKFNKTVTESASELINEINFTLNSYSSKLKNVNLNKIALMGKACEIPNFDKLLENSTKTKIEILSIKKVIRNLDLENRSNHNGYLNNSFITSLACAISPEKTENFSLQNIVPNIKKEKKLTNQVLSIFSLLGLITLFFIIFSFLRTRELKKAYNTSSQEAITQLKKRFNLPDKSVRNLNMANKAAQAKLSDLQKRWSPLSHKSNFSFLKYLYELSRHINKSDIDLDLSSIIMDQDEITLKGSVKNIDALRKFENQLKSESFTIEELPQGPDFKQKPIKLKIINHKSD